MLDEVRLDANPAVSAADFLQAACLVERYFDLLPRSNLGPGYPGDIAAAREAAKRLAGVHRPEVADKLNRRLALATFAH